MSDIKSVLFGVGYFLLAHIAVWFQLNGQFLWPWFKKNEVIVAATGIGISFLYIWGTKYTVAGFDGLLWPARFIGFSIGILIYALFVGHFFNQGITPKTAVSLLLCILLICIQVFWK